MFRDLAQNALRAFWIPGLGEVPTELEHVRVERVSMLGRRHVARELEELDRRVGGTSVAGGQCRSGQRGRNDFVGSIGSKRKMPRALLGVGDALCQLAVNVPAAADGCGRVDGCCEQWVGKEHAAPFVDPDDACSLGFCHADRIEQAECRLRERRRHEERVCEMSRTTDGVGRR